MTATPTHGDRSLAWRRSEPLRRRVAVGIGAGSFGAVVLAVVDTRWLRMGLDAPPPLWATLRVEVGLLAPVGVAVGLVVGLASTLVHPRAEPSLGGLVERLRDSAVGRPADVAAFAPLCVLGTFVWMTLAAQLARALLAMEASALAVGVACAAGGLMLGGVVAALVLALTPSLRHVLANWRGRYGGAVDPAVTSAVALGAVALALGYGVWRGTVSGEGGVLGIYGILKREELDLRAPAALAALSAAAYLAPGWLAAVRPYQALVAGLLPLALTVHASSLLDRLPDTAQLVARSAPIARGPLRLLRKLGDHDGDGASRWFGGGDCDDRDPRIGPGADDIPDNGIDEDCSGSDLSLKGLPAPAPPPAKPSPPRAPADGNLVLITVDTLRYDLGYTGYPRPVSPNIDKLAARSTVFERAYALASYTGKSVGPMLIGKYGSETHRNWGHFNKFSAEDTFVAERLQRAGIRTLSVQGHRYFGRFGGLERGCDVIDLGAAPPEGAKWATDTRVTSDRLTDAALSLLDKHGGGRFFLWVHYLDPHADYLPHDEVPRFGGGARGLYDAEVAFTDKHVGRLLDHIAKAPWAGRTSVILTSDHGEAFGENKMFRHGFELWEVLVRVPLLVHVPGAKPRRVAARRSLIDLVPTMLELMGQKLPPGPTETTAHDFVSGVSLLPDVWLEGDAEAARRDILIDMPGGPYNEPRLAFMHGDLKLIVSPARKELYDLATDPAETKNLWDTRRQEIEGPFALFKRRLRVIEISGPRK